MAVVTQISSMTGFGRSSQILESQGLIVECEIKSLNSRYLDLNLKLSRCFNEAEFDIRKFLAANVSRGKLDFILTIKSISQALTNVVDLESVQQKLTQVSDIYSKLGVAFEDRDKAGIINRAIAESAEGPAVKQIQFSEIIQLLEQAMRGFKNQRQIEAEAILTDMRIRFDKVGAWVSTVDEILQNHPQAVREKLKLRIEKVLENFEVVDQSRLMQEVALLVDKADVSEELTRLKAHLVNFRAVIDNGSKPEAVGKKLDFFCQEIFRELNTLGNKAANAEVQAVIVNCKVELEKIREQVQNLE